MNESFIVLFLFGDEARIFLQKSVIDWLVHLQEKKNAVWIVCLLAPLVYLSWWPTFHSPPDNHGQRRDLFNFHLFCQFWETVQSIQLNESMMLFVLLYVFFGLNGWCNSCIYFIFQLDSTSFSQMTKSERNIRIFMDGCLLQNVENACKSKFVRDVLARWIRCSTWDHPHHL